MTIQTSWEMMQQYREALDLAKWRKQVRAEHLEQIRLAGDFMRSLRYWLTVASSHRTLEARKAALAEHLARINALQTRQAVTFCCEIKLVGDSCQNNLRAAISWAETALTAPTSESWDNCASNAETRSADALVQLDVVRSTLKSLWKQAKADMNTARTVIDICAKDILHPVALPKAVRKEIIRVRCAKQQVKVFPVGIQNLTLYRFACAPTNNYHLVSAAACISQRAEGTVLNTKLWLRLVRTTRSNHVHRNAHNWNNRQDYLVRFPEHRTGIIDGRNWFVGSI